MTFIMTTKFAETPIIFGDCLITSPCSTSPHINIPTATSDEINNKIPNEYGIVSVKGLERKVVKINSKFVIAWAGTYIVAKYVVKKLFVQFAHYAPSLQELFTYCNGLDIRDNAIIIGWTICNDKEYSFFWDFNSSIGEETQGTYMEGSGKQSIAKRKRFSQSNNELDTIEQAIAQSLAFSSENIGEERNTLMSIYSMYGGGMEFMYCKNNEFHYPPKVMYLFWYSKFSRDNDQQIELLVPHFIEYWYYNNDLIIRSTRFDFADRKQSNIDYHMDMNDDSRVFIIPRFTKDPIIPDINIVQKKSFQASYYANYIYAEDRSKGNAVSITMIINPKTDPYLLEFIDGESIFRLKLGNLVPTLKKQVSFATNNSDLVKNM